MNWMLVSLADVPSQPWRNGGGSTRELLAWPSPGHWRVRASVADIAAPGPFSRFDGLERWFAVLEGDGVVLHVANAAERLSADSAPFRFDGGEAVDCTLAGGATRDFNLMAPPGRARLQRVRGELALTAGAEALLAVYAHAAPARVVLGGDPFDVPAFHFAWRLHDRASPVRVVGDDALWMEAMP